jgi:hypothetical protein
MKRCTLWTAGLVGLMLLAPITGSAQSNADGWKFSIMPYLWLPSVDGKLNYGPPPAGGGSANVDVSASSLLSNLAFAAMIAGEARKDRWLIGSDLIYLDLSNGDSKVSSVDLNPGTGPINIATTQLNVNAQASIKGVVWTMVGGYAAVQEPKASLDVIGGFRYLGLRTTTDWQLLATVTGTGPGGASASFPAVGSSDKSDNVWAGIVGAKGRLKLGESSWFVPYYLDVGGASSLLTWQALAGIGYAYRWGDVRLDYRYLYYRQSGDGLIDNMAFRGLALGVNFVF